MITREQLELAALAAGHELEYRHTSDAYYYDDPETGREEWRPHLDDGDAARLAVRLDIRPQTGSYRGMHFASAEIGIVDGMRLGSNCASSVQHAGTEPDKLRAWREAVVLCAAAVGERMQKGGAA